MGGVKRSKTTLVLPRLLPPDLERLQAEVEPIRLRRGRVHACPCTEDLEARHCALQQVRCLVAPALSGLSAWTWVFGLLALQPRLPETFAKRASFI